ncbi:MAG: precorrin-8X methylmutase [Candidatus Adiutrix sp.]|jgi:precorrin-8X/cobalt-precorrin-8 methylmutase|nr:precorrin-8X methylmutase [Candidatus Adiutrix sp.]
MCVQWNLQPNIIEDRSFSIITDEAGPHDWNPEEWAVIQRMVHTSADFDYVINTVISPGAIKAGVEAIGDGSSIVTDTKMALCGISTARLSSYGNRLICLIDDERTQRRARESGGTRAMAAVDLVYDLFFREAQDGGIWVVGNAPTALFRLLEKLAQEPERPRPRLIVGLPVGFVNASESKEALGASPYPHISNRGRKGGSNVAASVINALARLANARDKN